MYAYIPMYTYILMYTYIPIIKMKKINKEINIYCFILYKLDQAYAKLGMQLVNGVQKKAPFWN